MGLRSWRLTLGFLFVEEDYTGTPCVANSNRMSSVPDFNRIPCAGDCNHIPYVEDNNGILAVENYNTTP
eukprot:5787186-Pyramimonas_sp.AAC.1